MAAPMNQTGAATMPNIMKIIVINAKNAKKVAVMIIIAKSQFFRVLLP
jgi:hypothetical protein